MKILIKIVILLGVGTFSSSAFALTCQDGWSERDDGQGCYQGSVDPSSTSSTKTEIYTSELVPGASCKCVGATAADGKTCTGPVETRKYKCTVSTGLSGFQGILAEIVRTVVFVTMLLGVLAIVGLGIAWAWAGGDDVKMKSTLKTWGINVLVGLIILFLFRYILTFLAPWIFN